MSQLPPLQQPSVCPPQLCLLWFASFSIFILFYFFFLLPMFTVFLSYIVLIREIMWYLCFFNLFQFAWYPVVPCTSLKMARFHSIGGWVIFHGMYIPHLLYPDLKKFWFYTLLFIILGAISLNQTPSPPLYPQLCDTRFKSPTSCLPNGSHFSACSLAAFIFPHFLLFYWVFRLIW